MNNLFGTGRMIPGTGVILASAPGGTSGFLLGPMMAASPERDSIDFVAAASGGSAAATASVGVFLETVVRGLSLEAAITMKRLHHGGTPDEVLYEKGIADSTVAALTERGHVVAPTEGLGRVNAIWCPGGLPNEPDSCQGHSDPRASGLAIVQSE
jgi:gamma-glutamyltranspeptidase/glutathione hydrolase